MSEDLQIRLEALRMAISTEGHTGDFRVILYTATQYFKFLKGEPNE